MLLWVSTFVCSRGQFVFYVKTMMVLLWVVSVLSFPTTTSSVFSWSKVLMIAEAHSIHILWDSVAPQNNMGRGSGTVVRCQSGSDSFMMDPTTSHDGSQGVSKEHFTLSRSKHHMKRNNLYCTTSLQSKTAQLHNMIRFTEIGTIPTTPRQCRLAGHKDQ